MCLAIPMRVVSIEGDRAVAEQGGARRRVGLGLIDDVREGDYVLVHAGYAIARVDEDEARITLELIERLGRPRDAAGEADETS